ncbi:MAG TPA: hypothetical protein VLG74_12660 [Blastocatellia bacterium]|nr:hypothetical protein [Blastocatellia bacterium]
MKPSIRLCLTFASSVLLVSALLALGQENPKNQKATPIGTPVLWQEPSDGATRNLYLGPGGEAMKPSLNKVAFIEEKESADAAKFRVRDGAGREWVVKAGGEAQAEVAASRIVWAVGYHIDVSYLVPNVEIEGKGTFQNARFEARMKGVKRLDEWLWDDNVFSGTRELQGLKVLLALLDNWNLKNENNKILFVSNDEARSSELLYIVSDFDTKFDKSGASPGLWHATKEVGRKAKFIDNVKGNIVDFGYGGRHKERLAGITVDQAKWMGALLGRLSAQQIRDALRAANYSGEEVQVLEKTLRSRIDELLSLK